MSAHSEWNKLYIAHMRAKGIHDEKIQQLLAPVKYSDHTNWGQPNSPHHPVVVAEKHLRKQ